MKALLQQLIAYADRAARHVTSRTLGDRMRKIARAHGPTNPVGDGDAKTGAPGTYRPVGDTCPLSCDHHPENDGTCYALFHNVNRHQRRAIVDVDAALRSASVAIVWAVATDRVARLQVSGDMGRTVMDALEYIDGLIAIGEQVRAHYGPDTDCAWTYTALPMAGLDYVRRLKQVGIHVRLSGHNGHNGAIVYPHAKLNKLPIPPTWYDGDSSDFLALHLKCPAQLTHNAVDCQTCKACWTRPHRTIVFDPHGPRKRLAAETATA